MFLSTFRAKQIIGIITLFFVFSAPLWVTDVSDAAGRWRLLGKKTVNGKLDRDSIIITKARGPIRVLKFQVKGSALELHKIVVTFADGGKYEPETKLIFKKGSWSRTIDLPGKDRIVKRVDFYYSNLPAGGRAHLKLFGR